MPPNLQRVSQVIHDLAPDIVTLQEVDRNRYRTGYVDQAAILANLLDMEARYGPNLVDEAGEYGIATLTRHPVVEWRHDIYPSSEGWEPRGLLEVTVRVPGMGAVTVLNTHLQIAFGEDEDEAIRQRRHSAEVIADRARQSPYSVIHIGDFNADPGVPELSPLHEMTDAWQAGGCDRGGNTFPASPFRDPDQRIDSVLVGGSLRVESAYVVVSETTRHTSDHYPIRVELSSS